MKVKRKIFFMAIVFVLALGYFINYYSNLEEFPTGEDIFDNENLEDIVDDIIDEDASYSSPESVALYIHLYGKLPKNFIKKNDAMALGWKANEGNLWDVTDELSIGGDSFGNREGLLPKADGRRYFECDVNYEGGFRGAERIVYSDDGLIFYSKDHYQSFEQLY